MSFESFYGGRQGASFVIAKKFDGINIPQPNSNGVYTYTKESYALNDNGTLKIVQTEGTDRVKVSNGFYLVKKTELNEKNYKWKICTNDGTKIDNTQYVFPKTLAEGMIQCFAQGMRSVSEVGYGEYVFIDTSSRLYNRRSTDNGKVFRRGMDLESELAGAEYIGQISGANGISSIDFEIVPTMTKPKGYLDKNYKGAKLYIDINCTQSFTTFPYLIDSTLILDGADYNSNSNTKGTRIKLSKYPNNILYVDKSDCYKPVIRYKEVSYDNLEDGEITYKVVGPYKEITDIKLEDDGSLNIWNNQEGSSKELPLNYVVETCITKITPDTPNAPDSHLLVYYSSASYRNARKNAWVSYPSKKTGTIFAEWVDLGAVRGPAGGIHILKDVKSLDELKSNGNFVPPEKLVVNGKIATYAAGWGVTLTENSSEGSQILYFDYDKTEWYSIGQIGSSTKPTDTLIVSPISSTGDLMPRETDIMDTLSSSGYWIGTTEINAIY